MLYNVNWTLIALICSKQTLDFDCETYVYLIGVKIYLVENTKATN